MTFFDARTFNATNLSDKVFVISGNSAPPVLLLLQPFVD